MSEPFLHLQAILDESRTLASRFVDAGHKVYLVGGIVRDLWLNRPLGDELDMDLTTDAHPGTIKQLLTNHVDALWTQGERFGTIGAQLGGRAYEITTHRSESYQSDSRKPVVTYSTKVEEDLSRRDFTVNAMALKLPDAELMDPWGGATDLAAGVLRTPLTPEISFRDDPLRMLRAARFSSGYHLAPTAELVAAMTALAERLTIVSVERIRDELDKLLSVASPASGLKLLATTGVLHHMLPQVAALPRKRQEHLFGQVEAVPADHRLRLTVLLGGGELAHDTARDELARRMGVLRHSTERTRYTTSLSIALGALMNCQVGSDAQVRRWWAAARGTAMDALEVIDALGLSNDAAVAEHAVHVARRVQAMQVDLANLTVPITGGEIMDELGIAPGPRVGEAMDYLTELRFQQGPLTARQAIEALTQWASGDAG